MGRLNLKRKVRNLGKKTKRKVKNLGKKSKDKIKDTSKKVKSLGKRSKDKLKGAGKKVKKVAKKAVSEVKDKRATIKRKRKKVTKAMKDRVVCGRKNTRKKARKLGGLLKRNAKRVLNLNDFKLNVHFVICHDQRSFPDKRVDAWIEDRLEIAERLFAMKPRLKIKYSWERHPEGHKFLDLRFTRGVDYNRFMNKHFDHKAKGFFKGKMVFLVVDSLEVSSAKFRKKDMRKLGGKAYFPQCFGWSRHAITLTKGSRPYVLSHELGHVFGLHHTFAKGKLCTRKYGKGESGKSSTYKNGTMNVMDYAKNLTKKQRDTLKVRLNKCQEKTAAMTRRHYMSVNGKVNYLRIKGLA